MRIDIPGGINPETISTKNEQQPPYVCKVMNTQPPAAYVASHEITMQLKRIGVTEAQLDAMRFRPNNAGLPFDQWTFTWGPGTPLAAIPFIKAYCALKWLITENPEYSRDKGDASHLVSVTMAGPIYRTGIEHKNAQRLRAKRPRPKVTEDGQTVHSIIKQLALSPGHRDETARELWPLFFQILVGADSSPEERGHPNRKKPLYTYGLSKGTRASITFGRFATLISKYRKSHVSRAKKIL